MNIAIYAPIAIAIALFFLLSFLKQKKPFQLAFAIWMPSTILQYVSNDHVYFNILSVIEIVFFLFTMALLMKDSLDKKKKEKEKEGAEE